MTYRIERKLEGLGRIAVLFCCERQKGDLSGALDSVGQGALMRRASTCGPSRKDFSAIGNVSAQAIDALVVDIIDFIYAERAYFATHSPKLGGPAAVISSRRRH